jgi:hypothetical protein
VCRDISEARERSNTDMGDGREKERKEKAVHKRNSKRKRGSKERGMTINNPVCVWLKQPKLFFFFSSGLCFYIVVTSASQRTRGRRE